MVFSSAIFIFFFLPSVLLVYFLSPSNMRNGVLLCFSLIFYAWGEPIYVSIMIVSTIVAYLNGKWMLKVLVIGKKNRAKWILIASILFYLFILCFFKYSNFFIQNINALFHTTFSLLEMVLPIGISFYTFQTISYLIDIYRGTAIPQRNIIHFATYITMFPQLVAGPIVQYKDIAQQLTQRIVTSQMFVYGIKRFILGLAKKALLANSIGLLWEQIANGSISRLSVAEAWLGAISFFFQIYFDFSGYSDMAIGLGSMFGFCFKENFNYPYRAKSITEFWRKWHISLGTWFREYVYIPLGGNRKGAFRQMVNILIVWCLTGFWHGASWNFIVWGLYFAILLLAEKIIFKNEFANCPKLVAHLYTIFFIIIGWMIFAFDNMDSGILYIKAMFGLNGAEWFQPVVIYYLRSHGLLLAVCALWSINCSHIYQLFYKRIKGIAVPQMLAYSVLFLLSISFILGDTYNPFLYFRF